MIDNFLARLDQVRSQTQWVEELFEAFGIFEVIHNDEIVVHDVIASCPFIGVHGLLIVVKQRVQFHLVS